MARRARKRIPTALRSLWRRGTSLLPGIAAIALALAIGIGLGVWLGDTVDRPADPAAKPQATAVPPVKSPGAAPSSAPANPQLSAPRPSAPQTSGPRPSVNTPPPRIAVAPWVSDLRNAPPSRLELPAPSMPSPYPETSSPEIGRSPPASAPRHAEAMPLWRRNAVPVPAAAQGHPMVAVVIDDMGVDQHHSAEALNLPGPLTLAFLPYAHNLARQTAAARAHGHELLVHIPMQPIGGNGSYANPGPNALMVDLPPDEIRRRLSAALASFDGYVGINNHMGSRFTSDSAGMAIVMAELKARGLLFLDSRTWPASKGEAAAEAAGVTHVGRDVFLDNVQSPAELHTRLAELERIARKHGAAIAIGHPHPVTIAALRDWLPRLRDKGLVLVPVSAVAEPLEVHRDAVHTNADPKSHEPVRR